MRPFPIVEYPLPVDDPAVPEGLGTIPTRQDVLFGSRLDVKSIGAFHRWLEFHPGNQKFQLSAKMNGGTPLYRSYFKDLPPVFVHALVDAIMEPVIAGGGRILYQDYRTGDWLHTDDGFTYEILQKSLYVGFEGPLYQVHKELQLLLGDARFGYKRETSMDRNSIGLLNTFESRLFDRFVHTGTTQTRTQEEVKSRFRVSSSAVIDKVILLTPRRSWNGRSSSIIPKTDNFVAGEDVFVSFGMRKYPASILNVDDKAQTVDLAIYGMDIQELGYIIMTANQSSIEKSQGVYEGSRVWANYKKTGEYFSGTITRLLPLAYADIVYDDGSFEARVPPEMYNLLI